MHTLLSCPRYNASRARFMASLCTDTQLDHSRAAGSTEQLRSLFSSIVHNDWQAFGEFVHRIRQSRRLLRIEFENRSIRLRKHGFYPRKAAWRKKGLAVCRHGLFFNAPSAGFQCPCSGQPAHSDALWQKAVLMPIIDEDLRSITAVPFVAGRQERLRVLQHRLRSQE